MPKFNYSKWLTKQEAADAIGVSTKLIERMAKEGEIQQARWKRPSSGAWISVYHPGDVETVRAKRHPEGVAFVMPPQEETGSEPSAGSPLPAVTRPAMPEQAAAALATLFSGLSRNSETRNVVRTTERIFLSVPEASDYSGLPQSYIRQLMKDEKLTGIKTGSGWRIRRKDLEAL